MWQQGPLAWLCPDLEAVWSLVSMAAVQQEKGRQPVSCIREVGMGVCVGVCMCVRVCVVVWVCGVCLGVWVWRGHGGGGEGYSLEHLSARYR